MEVAYTESLESVEQAAEYSIADLGQRADNHLEKVASLEEFVSKCERSAAPLQTLNQSAVCRIQPILKVFVLFLKFENDSPLFLCLSPFVCCSKFAWNCCTISCCDIRIACVACSCMLCANLCSCSCESGASEMCVCWASSNSLLSLASFAESLCTSSTNVSKRTRR